MSSNIINVRKWGSMFVIAMLLIMAYLKWFSSTYNFETNNYGPNVNWRLPKNRYREVSSSQWKSILFWNLKDLDKAYGFEKYDFGEGNEHFYSNHCPDTRCFTTSDRSYLKSVEDFDAIVIHQRGPSFNGLEMEKSDMPQKRRQSQYYVFWEIESASYPYMDMHKLDNFFNWTMTTRKNSDIFLPYGRIVKIKDHPPPGPELDALIQEFGQKNQHLAQNRSNIPNAAWFVSNCETQSHREQFVNELLNYMTVDVFGTCSKKYNKNHKEKKCPKSDTYNGSEDSCYKMLEEKYRFYLSFENSICQDYVTEKFFRPMEHIVIPLTLNGADMKNIAPPYSFINSLDFDSTLQLIQFLVKISKDDALYASYFWWKDYYEVRNDHKDRAQSYCDLCAKLNNPNEPPKYYGDMYKWWIQDSNCHRYSRDLSLNYQPPRDYNG